MFCVVAEELNITKAAQRLHIAQQTLSYKILSLEKEYGISFFDRKNNLRLTAAGHRFYEFALQIRDSEEAMNEDLQNISSNHLGFLKIGVAMAKMGLLSEILNVFHEAYPMIKLSVTGMLGPEMPEKLLRGDFDLVIHAQWNGFTDKCFKSDFLKWDQMCLVLSKKIFRNIPGNRSFEEFCALPKEQIFKELTTGGVLQDLPFVVSGYLMKKRAQLFFEKYVPRPDIVLELPETNVAFTFPFANMGVIFTFESLLPWLQDKRDSRSADYCVVPLPSEDIAPTAVVMTYLSQSHCWERTEFFETVKRILPNQLVDTEAINRGNVI